MVRDVSTKIGPLGDVLRTLCAGWDGKKTKLGLGETAVLDLSKKLENTHCMLYFENFFNSPTLVEELFDRGMYCLGTV